MLECDSNCLETLRKIGTPCKVTIFGEVRIASPDRVASASKKNLVEFMGSISLKLSNYPQVTILISSFFSFVKISALIFIKRSGKAVNSTYNTFY